MACALEQLPYEQREVVVLRYFGDLTFAAIARSQEVLTYPERLYYDFFMGLYGTNNSAKQSNKIEQESDSLIDLGYLYLIVKNNRNESNFGKDSNMKQQTSVWGKVCWKGMLIVVGGCVLVALGQSEAEDSNRTQSTTVLPAGNRKPAQMNRLEKQSDETNDAYQARLRLTIRGLLRRQVSSSTPPKRENETTAAYQRRIQVPSVAFEVLGFSLIARPGEEEAAYFDRLAVGSEDQSVSVPPRRPNESEVLYKARVRATIDAQTSGDNSSQ